MPDEKLARALGSKIRRDMLHLLLQAELSVHEMAQRLELSEVNASKHLKKLYDLGLLNSMVRGRERYYSIRINHIKSLISAYDKVVRQMGGAQDANV